MSTTTPGGGRLSEDEKMSSFTPVNNNTNSNSGGNNSGTIVVGQKPPGTLPAIAPAPHPSRNSSPVLSSSANNPQEEWPGRSSAELSMPIQKRKRSPEPGSTYHAQDPQYPEQQAKQRPSPSRQLQAPQTPQPPHQAFQQAQLHDARLPQNPPLSPAFGPITPSMKTTPVGEEEIPNQQRNQDSGTKQAGNTDEDTPMTDQPQPLAGPNGQDPTTPSAGDSDKKPPRKRQFSNRTKTGCLTCRRRKKKCDEGKPECNNCRRGGFNCEGYAGKINWTKPPGKSGSVPVALNSKGDEGSASASPTLPSVPPLPQHSPAHHLATDGGRIPFSGLALPNPDQQPTFNGEQVHSNDPFLVQNSGTVGQPLTSSPAYPSAKIPTQVTPPQIDAAAQPSSSFSQDLAADPNAKTEKQKMLTGELFYANTAELEADRQRCKSACYRFNNAISLGTSKAEHERLLHEILKPKGPWVGSNSISQGVNVETPFNCTYGYNITIEDNVLIAGGVTVLDSNEVVIKKRAIIEANCTIYTASRPFDPRKREGGNGPQRAQRVVIGEDAWLAGNVTVLPGVTIGKGAVIGAGSVVTKDVPPFTVSYGNPASVIRGIYSNGIDS